MQTYFNFDEIKEFSKILSSNLIERKKSLEEGRDFHTVNGKIVRRKNKTYETYSYDSYAKDNAKLNISYALNYLGWTIYGFKEDRSDSMTDYFDFESWKGIAVKNGYILVIENSSGGIISGNCVMSSYSEDAMYQVNKLTKKIEKLENLANNVAASIGEVKNSCALIEKYKQDIIKFQNEYYLCYDNKSNPYPKDLPPVEYQKNPKGSNWHIEKNGRIIAKGNGYIKFANVKGFSYRSRNICNLFFKKKSSNNIEIIEKHTTKSWKIAYNNILKKQDGQEGLLDDFMKFLNKLNDIVKLKIGDSEEETLTKKIKTIQEVYFTAEKTNEKTEYIKVSKKYSSVSGLIAGRVYKIIGDNEVVKVTKSFVKIDDKYITTFKKEPNKSTKSQIAFNLKEKINDGKLIYIKLVENIHTFEKEDYVKQKPSKRKAKTSSKNYDFEKMFISGEVIEVNNEKTNKKYKVIKLNEKLELTTFKKLCDYLKDNQLGFYVKGKGVYLNSLNNENVA
ncbi:hypothetical protein CP985_14190 [Malaciobacter mytili LMG 24559]|uniref:Uncharacterized protein n=1 Tax=Malaciobacter mytili LMG 24559 TaxID=1032238 RepID=A0AAX2ABD3_9BACT|nr:hypothetical protein [Malaciobacter mytili]AXH16339.1 hypothetical protein AMYT_a0039 [Malaciobacter mytili LMG 24559]RXK12863.1 hypothetical protein CP985_14190 [Malaciobacter mytili LMG 24559]